MSSPMWTAQHFPFSGLKAVPQCHIGLLWPSSHIPYGWWLFFHQSYVCRSKWTMLWSDRPSGGRGDELEVSLGFAYSKSTVLFLLWHLVYWVKVTRVEDRKHDWRRKAWGAISAAVRPQCVGACMLLLLRRPMEDVHHYPDDVWELPWRLFGWMLTASSSVSSLFLFPLSFTLLSTLSRWKLSSITWVQLEFIQVVPLCKQWSWMDLLMLF